MGTKNGVVPEIDGAPSSWESQNVRYRIVTDGGRGGVILDDIDMSLLSRFLMSITVGLVKSGQPGRGAGLWFSG